MEREALKAALCSSDLKDVQDALLEGALLESMLERRVRADVAPPVL